MAATLGGYGRHIGIVTGSDHIEIRVGEPGNDADQLTVTVEAARRAFGCGPLGS